MLLHHPVALGQPGAGGAPEIASCAGEVLLVLKHSARAFVRKLDFVTSVGHLDGGDAKYPLASPVFGDFAGLAPMLIQVGSEETLLGDSLLVAERENAARIEPASANPAVRPTT